MIKNIGKLKQWTGEKFGSVKTTLQTEDFQRLEVEIDRKRISYEKLHAAAGLMQIQLAKKKPSPEDGKSKRLPNDMFGVCMTNYASEFSDVGSPLAIASHNMGYTQSRLGSLQEDYADTFRLDYLETLERGLTLFKEYTQLRKKLESRRLDYDAKLGRLQKSKKENPGLEQETQAAKLKYEDSEYDVIQKMASLQEFEEEHAEAMQQFLNVQVDYYQKSLEALQEVKQQWGQPMVSKQPSSARLAGLTRTSSNDDYVTRSPTVTSRKNSIGQEALTPPVRRTMRSASFNSDHSVDINHARSPPVLPRRTSQTSTTTTRKAIYEFSGENTDELAFHVGDIITVLEEVDEGWWLGDIDGRRGIFPVNYTELFNSPPVMPQRPPTSTRPLMKSTLSSTTSSYIEEEEEDSSPFTNRYQASPISSPKPVVAAKRAPPPPPTSRGTPPPRPAQSRSGSTATRTRTAPNTPLSNSQQTSYFDNSSTEASCGDCGCEDFSANIFKKGHCNNCFHKHF